MTMPPERDWWQALYDDIIADLLLHRNDEAEHLATIAFLRDHLCLMPGDRVLDQCCGIGVLALGLARAGHVVVGVDQAKAYCGEARHGQGQVADSPLCCRRCPQVRTAQPCIGTFNWNTGFGNGSDDANQRMLRRAFETLEPGGRFALDYQHIPRILGRFSNLSGAPARGASGETVLLRKAFSTSPAEPCGRSGPSSPRRPSRGPVQCDSSLPPTCSATCEGLRFL